MNRKFCKQGESLDHAELARLLPAPTDPQLTRDRQLLLEEHLLNEIHASNPTPAPARRAQRRALFIGIPVTAAALVATLAVDLTGGTSDGTPAAVAPVKAPVVRVEAGSAGRLGATVERIAAATTTHKLPEPRAGQYIYIKRKVSYLATEINASTDETKTWVQPLHQREIWMSPDGKKGWLDEPGYQPAGGITLDEDGPNSKPSGQDLPGAPLLHNTYNWLKAQPADPDALLAYLYSIGIDERDRHQQAFEEIESIIGNQLVPSRTAAALYRAAAKIPGVVVVNASQDAVGRTGIALARLDEETGERTELVFDRKTFTYLGSRGVQTKQNGTIKPGTVVERTAVLERSVVNAQKERPGATSRA